MRLKGCLPFRFTAPEFTNWSAAVILSPLPFRFTTPGLVLKMLPVAFTALEDPPPMVVRVPVLVKSPVEDSVPCVPLNSRVPSLLAPAEEVEYCRWPSA